MTMTHGSLFSGIGGFDKAAEWMGWENRFHCEWNPFGQQVLKHYWPKAISYNDITTTDFSIWRGKIDILTGGFPCQPFSTAGKRKGTGDARYLWPEMLRVIREVRPQWVVGENVYGLVNWDGGLVFDTVCLDLENEGFKVLPVVLPACGVNAPHQRYRIWFIAYANHQGRGNGLGEVQEEDGEISQRNNHAESSNSGERSLKDPDSNGRGSDFGKAESDLRELWDAGSGNHESISADHGEIVGYSERKGLEGGVRHEESKRFNKRREEYDVTDSDIHIGRERRLYQTEPEEAERYISTLNARDIGRAWENFPTQPPLRSGNDGIPSGLSGITVSKHRQESIKGYGNAIVPQLALQIFKTINDVQTTSGY